jgi:carboxylate-amine ligase
VIETLKAFVAGKFIDLESQMKWKTETLAQMLDKTTDRAQEVVIDNEEYLNVFGFPGKSAKVPELWQHIITRLVRGGNSALEHWKREIDVILTEGTLAQRITRALGKDHSNEHLLHVYRQLSGCLAQNRMFFS